MHETLRDRCPICGSTQVVTRNYRLFCASCGQAEVDSMDPPDVVWPPPGGFGIGLVLGIPATTSMIVGAWLFGLYGAAYGVALVAVLGGFVGFQWNTDELSLSSRSRRALFVGAATMTIPSLLVFLLLIMILGYALS